MKKLTATIGGALTMQAFCLSAPLLVLIAAAVMLGGAVTLFIVEGRWSNVIVEEEEHESAHAMLEAGRKEA